MKKILRNGMLIIIAICITTYLVIGVTSIYRSSINKHNNLLNNVDDELVYDNENNSTAETKDNATNSDKNTNNNSNKDDSNKNNSSSSSNNSSSNSSKNNSSSSSSKNNSSSNSNKNNSSSSSNKNNSSSNSSKSNSSSSSSKNNSSSSSSKNNSSSSSSKNNSSSSSNNNSSSSSNKNNSSSSSSNNSSSSSNKNNSSSSSNNNSSSTKPSQTVKVTGVSLNKTSAEIYLNNDTGFSVSATVSPSNATNKNITWSSSNSNIASVNNGYITAHNPGAATITVKTVDGNKQASINVVVKKKVIVIIGASQVTRMVWYKNSYSSSRYKYNVDNGTLVYVNESGTGISRAKNIIGKYSSYKNYTYFYVFFPLSGNTIQSFSCDEISSTNSTIKKFASGYNTSIQSIKNSGYNVKGYVVSMHPVRVSQRGNNTKIVTNEDSNSCTKSYRSNYKYYKFNLAMKSIVESSYSNNLKYEPIFIQIMDTKQGKKVNFSYKITYNTTDGMHWDSNTTNTYVNMMLGYINEL